MSTTSDDSLFVYRRPDLTTLYEIIGITVWEQGRHFIFFQGGHNFDQLPKGGGAKYEKNKIL